MPWDLIKAEVSLRREHEEMLERRSRLRDFIDTREFFETDPEDQEAMRAQLSVMTSYIDILTRRRQRLHKKAVAWKPETQAHN